MANTPKLDARAVLRIINRQDRLTRELAAAKADLLPHARRLMDHHGYRATLSTEALRTLAERTVQ